MSLKTLIFVSFILMSLIISCSYKFNFDIDNLDVASEYKFNVSHWPSNLVIKCEGNNESEAGYIEVFGNDKNHYIKIPINKPRMDTLIRIEWYSKENKVFYNPGKSSNGRIELDISLG